jgi:DNA-binding transcriptional LysR family regulator
VDDQKSRSPTAKWMRENVPLDRVVFRSDDFHARHRAVVEGAGIGFATRHQAREYDTLTEVMPPRDEWSIHLWLVTHMDLHRTSKVQAFLNFLKDRAAEWER